MQAAERKNRRNKELCRLIRENDPLAGSRLIRENEGLIIQIVRKFTADWNINSNDGMDEEDLLQEGRIVMLFAARKYDESKNVKFTTYAYEVIYNALTNLLRSRKTIYFERQMRSLGWKQVFLDESEIGEKAFYGKGTDVNYQDPAGNLAVRHVMLLKLFGRLKLLPERQRRLLVFHYGLGNQEDKKISEAASYFHLTERNLRKIEKEALADLREMMNDGKII